MNDPSYDPALAEIHSRLLAWSPAPATGVISDVPGPVFGGVDSRDDKEAKAGASPAA